MAPARAGASPAYEYYGYAPPSNFSSLDAHPEAGPNFRLGWQLDPATGYFAKSYGHVDNGTCYLDVIGYNDSTRVEVFDITGAELIPRESFTVNRMQLYNTTVPAKTYFKVVADKPVAVMVGGGWSYASGFNLFYPSTDGGYAGTEFIFLAIYGRGAGTSRSAPGGAIYALEKAKVTVYDERGIMIWERELDANTTRTVTLSHRQLYRVVSTGRVMVATWSRFTVKAVPAPMGGFRGTYFFVWQDANTGMDSEPQRSALFIVNQEKASHVKVADMANDQTMIEKDLSPRSLWFLTSKEVDFVNKPVMVKSTGEITVLSGSVYAPSPVPVNMDPDVMMVGVRADEPTTLYAISRAVAFSPKAAARVTVGGFEVTIPKGRYAELPKGLITVSSNATLVVELISQPATTFPDRGEPQPLEVTALNSWGVYLLPAEGVEVAYPPPKAAAGLDLTLYGAVAGAAAIAAIAALWARKREAE
ncbi:MAG: hypothetical protein QW587_11155 [Candidatus Bathyarchaeia archaeon]